MRPSFDLDGDLMAAPESGRGTERHTLADAPRALHAEADRVSLMDDFFSAGDEGRYEGGPATIIPLEELELDDTPVAVAQRTPAMDARRARFTRVVAAAIGCLAAVLTIGAVKSRAFAHGSAEPERAAAVARAAHGVKAKAKSEAAPDAKVEEAKVAATPEARAEAAPEAKPSAPADGPEAKPALQTAAKPATVPAAMTPTAPAAPKIERVSGSAPPMKAVEAPPQPTRALPSVANFAAKAGDPAKAASKPPTASFAVVK